MYNSLKTLVNGILTRLNIEIEKINKKFQNMPSQNDVQEIASEVVSAYAYSKDEADNKPGNFVINASTNDYSCYTFDCTFDEIKEKFENGIMPTVKLQWGPNENQIKNYMLGLVCSDDYSFFFEAYSSFPSVGKLNLTIEDDAESYIGTNLYLPFPDGKGKYLVGTSSFGWELVQGPVVYSPNGTKYIISVDNEGVLSATPA